MVYWRVKKKKQLPTITLTLSTHDRRLNNLKPRMQIVISRPWGLHRGGKYDDVHAKDYKMTRKSVTPKK